MSTKMSVIIPVYNSKDTIEECLKSVYNSDYKNYEVIVVDDRSTDNSIEIIKKFPCKLIRMGKNSGPAKARNTGVKYSKGDILLFMDADVLIKKNTLKKFNDSLKRVKEASAIQAIYSKYVKYNNFSNIYKMLYLTYGFNRVSEDFIPTIASYCAAIKKSVFVSLKGYNENIPTASSEDDEFGHKLSNKGYKIYLDKEIECDHIVKLDLIGTIKRDFIMASAVVKSILRNENNEMKNTIKNKKFATNVGLDTTISPLIALFIFLSIIFLILKSNYFTTSIFFVSIALFLFINNKFLKYIKENKGLIFTIKSFFFTLIDMLFIAFAGITSCVEYFIFNKKY